MRNHNKASYSKIKIFNLFNERLGFDSLCRCDIKSLARCLDYI